MLRITLLVIGCCLSTVAAAADNGIYLGAGIAQSDYGLSNPLDAEPFDDKDNGFKLIAGWRPLDNFGIEANYIDHGNATVPAGIVCTQFITTPCPFESGLKAKTVAAFAVGYLDFPLVDLFAKVGVNAWDFDVRSSPAASGFAVSDDGTEFAWGAGVQARFGSLGARLEYEQFNIIDDEKLGTISLSLTYTFL
jgi:hypothetical protein